MSQTAIWKISFPRFFFSQTIDESGYFICIRKHKSAIGDHAPIISIRFVQLVSLIEFVGGLFVNTYSMATLLSGKGLKEQPHFLGYWEATYDGNI